MRIGLDATSIFGFGGIKTYARQLAAALASRCTEDSIVLLSTFSSSRRKKLKKLFRDHSNVEIKAVLPHPMMLGEGLLPLTRLISAFISRTFLSHMDVIHITDPYGSALPSGGAVVTVHDVFPLTREEYLDTPLREYYQKKTPVILRKAAAVIVPTEYVRESLVSRYGRFAHKVYVVPEAASKTFSPSISCPEVLEENSISKGSYFLFVGRADPRKNLENLLEAFRLYRKGGGDRLLLLVLSGSAPLEPELTGGDHVGILRDVSQEQLETLYAAAEAFVFPTLDEGFGLPVLEAMQSGCPVISSRTSCIPEVAGEAALLTDPEDPEEIAEAMELLAGSSKTRGELVGKGLERAAEFSWSRSAEETMEVYLESLI
ncbi:MAG: glycosyltransferase [Candidatus Aegiribacteria sp.]|nr:glycosyltransferase [Candidatus Aegiribacteria sp.]